MEADEINEKVAALDFSILVSDLVERGQPQDRAERAVEQYKQFFATCAIYPAAPLVPTHLCDLAWHAHMLRPAKYARDCIAVMGHVMDHNPGVYRVGSFQDAYDLTRKLVPFGATMPADAYAPNNELAGAECWREPGEGGEDPLFLKRAA